MQLRFRGQSAVVVLVKTPEFYCQSVEPGETIDVADGVAHAIIGAHAALFAPVEVKQRRKIDLVEKGEVKLRKKAVK